MTKWMVRLFFVLLFCGGLKAAPPDTTKKVRAVEIQQSGGFFGTSFYRVFHLEPFTIYENQYGFSSSDVRLKFDSSGNPLSSVTENERSEIRNKFFVFHRDSSFGVTYDPHQTGKLNVRSKVDSVLGLIRGSNNYQNLLTKKPDSISWNSNKTKLREVYLEKATKDTPSVRVILYYSSKMNGLRESLNTMLDSAKGMKLYKHEFVIEEFYSKTQGLTWPEMIHRTEMKEIKARLPMAVMQHISDYRQSHKSDRRTRNQKKV